MQVIVEHEAYAAYYLGQYAAQVQRIDKSHALIEIEEHYLPWLKDVAKDMEFNFLTTLRPIDELLTAILPVNQDIILAMIGQKCPKPLTDHFYSLQTHTLQQESSSKSHKRCEIISCFSEKDAASAWDYIKCTENLCYLAETRHKRLIIYANVEECYPIRREHLITYKIMNSFLAKINGIMLLKSSKERQKNFNLSHILTVSGSLSTALPKGLIFLQKAAKSKKYQLQMGKERQPAGLYSDIFYRSIPPEQPIYVLLGSGEIRSPEYYRSLGLKAIPLMAEYSMLYAAKSQFDALSSELREEVVPQYELPILSYPSCDKGSPVQNPAYTLVSDPLRYRGEKVYIGIVAADDIDYTNDVLRTQEGQTRIACIWRQQQADDGIFYFKKQIDEALLSEAPEQLIPLPEEDSISTMMLAISGGASSNLNYNGIAVEAEFVLSKINTAPVNLQEIYGGMPSKNGVLMPDIMIGALKLIQFAEREDAPLVLCIPFNANIDAHDGTAILQEILSLMARRPGMTLIMPTGEEADKMHHYGMSGEEQAARGVTIRVPRDNQNVIAIIYQRFSNIRSITLQPPAAIGMEPIDLKVEGITTIGQGNIYCSGEHISFQNGANRILFRMERPVVGEWRIEAVIETELASQIDIWLSQQELNASITISPSVSFMTAGSLAMINNVMSVGGFDGANMVVLRSSGRGYSWDNRVRPLLVAQGSALIAPCAPGEWVRISGTLPAAGVMLGVVAAFYSKFMEVGTFPLPNTQVINNLILSQVKQFEGVEYPNPNQGYGIFDLESLNRLLSDTEPM